MNEKQRKFAEFYAKNPNATDAAKLAGYSEKTARSQGQRLLTNVDIKNYIKELQDKAANERILIMTQTKAFWSDIMNDSTEKTSNRLKASELLAKSAGAFVNITAHGENDEIMAEYCDDVIIYMPEKMCDSDCVLREEGETD